jgi:hypothetical protein
VSPSNSLVVSHSVAPLMTPSDAFAQPQVYVSAAELLDPAHGAILVKDCDAQGSCVFRVDATSDGGATWRHGGEIVGTGAVDAGSPSEEDAVIGLAMSTSSDLYAYGASLWHSLDAGATWTVVPQAPAVDIIAIDHHTVWLGVACTGLSGCMSSVDTLTVGRPVSLAHQPPGDIGDIARHGAVADLVMRGADGMGVLEVSRDDGASWQRHALPQTYCGYSLGPGPLAVTATGVVYLLCTAGAGVGNMPKDLFVSHDDGTTWRHLATLETYGYADSMVAATPTLLWRFGGRAPIYLSTDAGRTWRPELADKLGDAAGPMTQAFAAAGSRALVFGFALPPDPSFEGPWTINEYLTTDAGATWSTVALSP